MTHIKRILFFIALVGLYFIGKEALGLYTDLRDVHPYLGYGFIALSVGMLLYFVVIPVVKLMTLPLIIPPATNRDDEAKVITQRLERLKSNPYLLNTGNAIPDDADPDFAYQQAVEVLKTQCFTIRRKYVNQVFLSTAISQNGFLDAIFILSANVNMIKEIFTLYNGRHTTSDLLKVAAKVYTAIAIGGSEAVEYAVDELISKSATEGIRKIPFLNLILSSFADGFVNATLLTRISFIVENYCSMTYIASDGDLLPGPKVLREVVMNLTEAPKEVLKEKLTKRFKLKKQDVDDVL